MMNEKPLEWITEVGESSLHKAARYLCLAATIFCFMALTVAGIIAIAATIVFGILLAWLWTHSFVEYEYNYFSEDMEISAIYNKSRRKKKLRFTLSDVEYAVKRVETKETTKYFCRKEDTGNLYTLVVNQDGKRMAVVIEGLPEFTKVLEMKRKLR